MGMHRIEILQNVVPSLRDIYLFGKKNSFFSVRAAKKLIKRLKTIFSKVRQVLIVSA